MAEITITDFQLVRAWLWEQDDMMDQDTLFKIQNHWEKLGLRWGFLKKRNEK